MLMYSERAKGFQTQRPTDVFVSLGGTSFQIEEIPTIESSWKVLQHVLKLKELLGNKYRNSLLNA